MHQTSFHTDQFYISFSNKTSSFLHENSSKIRHQLQYTHQSTIPDESLPYNSKKVTKHWTLIAFTWQWFVLKFERGRASEERGSGLAAAAHAHSGAKTVDMRKGRARTILKCDFLDSMRLLFSFMRDRNVRVSSVE